MGGVRNPRGGLEPVEMHGGARAVGRLRWLGHLGWVADARLARQLWWATLPEGAGWPGRATQTLFPQVY